MSLQQRIAAAADFLKQRLEEHKIQPIMAIVLGSGLDSFAETMERVFEVPYGDIPGFPTTSVIGHPGILAVGYLQGKPIMVFRGRVHIYEGYQPQEVVFSVRLLKHLNIHQLILTNAVGGMRPEHYLGALVLVEDHINFAFANPLMGPNDPQQGPRFPDMTFTYDNTWRQEVFQIAAEEGIRVHSGILGVISGPSYMSTAELKMLRRLGADVVGMSTVPEAIVASQEGIRLLAISCVTDLVVPEAMEPIDHEMVIRVAKQTRPKFAQLVGAIVSQLPTSEVQS